MIFYFSGTGNSKYVANKVGETLTEEVIYMADELKSGKLTYNVKENEKIGFVFPVYSYGVPSVVMDFIKKANFNYTGNPYVFVIVTCGGSIANTIGMFEKELLHTGLKVSAGFSHLMPDNYIPMYNVPTAEQSKERLDNGNDILFNDIIPTLKSGMNLPYKANIAEKIQTSVMYPAYVLLRGTKKFYATDSCTSCGLCERVCPTDTIKLENGKPVWKNDKCAKCLACIHRCPTAAIQHGKGTEKRNRYVHPECK